MTEAAGVLSSTSYWDTEGGHVGGVNPCNRMHIRDVPELDLYVSENNMVGELYVKGNSVFKGYYKNPELTKEVLDEDGWLKIGDVVSIQPNGSMKIVDRVKEVKKLQNGQYIVPSKLECIYNKCQLVDQIYVDINQESNFLSAVVSLNEEKLMQYANTNNLKGQASELIFNPDVEKDVLKQLERIGKTNGLDEIEMISRIHLVHEKFSVSNGLLTNSQKPKRKEIHARYEKDLTKLYQAPKYMAQGQREYGYEKKIL